ncbi:hypothetical protein FB451DRAFT_311355 [Mycena latifolia]|nr:hypothetical protein FB451DRAFT_311355 [Mycena latifolia]
MEDGLEDSIRAYKFPPGHPPIPVDRPPRRQFLSANRPGDADLPFVLTFHEVVQQPSRALNDSSRCAPTASPPPMFKGILSKWPTKRPREPAGPDSLADSPSERQPFLRTRFKLFRKTARVVAQEVHSAPANDHGERHARSKLDAAAFAAKMLLLVCDAPVLSVAKSFLGPMDYVFQRAQTLRSNEEAIAKLEHRAKNVGTLLDNISNATDAIGSPLPSQCDEIIRILDEEIAPFLDSADSRRKRLKFKL